MKRIGIIGGGLGGLAAACTLAARGYSVVLFERNDWLGGKAAVLEQDGFRFDMGPTIVTLPSVLRRIFAEAGHDLDDSIDLVRLDPQWRSFFADGSTLDLHSDSSSMFQELTRFSPATSSAEGYERFLHLSERLHRISRNWFFYRPVGGLRDMFNAGNMVQAATLGDLLALRMGRSVGGTVRSFIPDARVAQMVDHFTQYVGSAPDSSPAVLCGIAHMQTSEGISYPRGGTGEIPRALVDLARELGVELRTDSGVRRIMHESGAVSGVELESGEIVRLEAVVANSDAVRTHRELLGGVPKFERRRRYEPACSGVVLYLGLKRQPAQLLHHNFVFSRDPHEEFDFIYRKGEPAPDPTCYVCAPGMTDPTVAPEGGEALYVLVHTPYLRPHHDWKKMLPEYRRVILEKLRCTAGLELESEIVTENALTPQDIHERYGVLNGAIYGIASHGRWTGAFKPSNRSPDLRGLYLAGGAAHPGPGMPMVMMSGWIAADALDRDLGGRPLNAATGANRRLAPEPGARVKTPGAVPEISQPLLALFSRYAGWYLGRHFHSIRLLAAAHPPNDLPGPLVVFLNHAAWWDPLVCLLLRREFFERRSAYAPIEAAALTRYQFLKRLGFFPVETGTTRGAAQFLRTSTVILAQEESALFLTPQGTFADVRAPLVFAPGLDHLVAHVPEARLVPLAIEYSFWEERRPEILLAFGEAQPVADSSPVQRLAQLQAELATAALRRAPNEWRILRRGRSGVSRPYDFGRWIRARLHGEAFRADHGQL